MLIYKIEWLIKDPTGDIKGDDLITASRADRARQAVRAARPGAEILSVEEVGEA